MSSAKQWIFSAANLWVGIDTARYIAEYAAKYLHVNGYSIVTREAMQKLRESYGDEFTDYIAPPEMKPDVVRDDPVCQNCGHRWCSS